jgi:hypothetical protein
MSQPQSNQITQQIQTLLTQDVREANQRVQFSQRQRRMSAEGFVQLLVLGWLRHPRASLNQLTRSGAALGIQLSASGLHQRLTDRAVVLLADVLKAALARFSGGCPLPVARLQAFRAVYITDSTQIALPQALYPMFAGNGLNSSVKLQVTWDYLHGHLAALELTPGRQPDQTCRLHITHAADQTLQLFDLGYFKQEYLREIDDAQAFFVCRYQHQTALFHPATGDRFDLQAWLQSLTTDGDCWLQLGQRVRLPVRLLVRRVSEAEVQARRRAARRKARKQGYTCSAASLSLLAWDMLVTNLPETWTLAEAFVLYGIRGQIEWLFRLWKDQLAIDDVGLMRPERVLCHLYAHAIGAVLCQALTAPWRWRRYPYSPLKCAQIICDQSVGLMRCLARQGYGFAAWMKRLEADFRRFARATQRRKSPSTAQILHNWILT